MMRNPSQIALSVLALLALDLPAASSPVAGIDIVIARKAPLQTPSIVAATTDGSGRFYARVMERGDYMLSTACRQSPCPPHRLSLGATGTTLQQAADGSYAFSANGRPVVIRGVVETVDAPAVD